MFDKFNLESLLIDCLLGAHMGVEMKIREGGGIRVGTT
jgi:hypothetical protein